MSTTVRRPATDVRPGAAVEPPEELHNGDRMTREEFHRAYSATPKDLKAELIGGIVYVASPVSRRHGRPAVLFNTALGLYEAKTPGVEALSDTTVFLGDDSEPQPDVSLRVLPEYGGRSRTTEDGNYVVGPPEFVVEVANSTKSIDMHSKRADYARHGVLEYVVWIVQDGVFAWFDLAKDVERPGRPGNVLESFAFPGLWLDGNALRRGDLAGLTSTLEEGLATPEHAAFVDKLAAAKR